MSKGSVTFSSLARTRPRGLAWGLVAGSVGSSVGTASLGFQVGSRTDRPSIDPAGAGRSLRVFPGMTPGLGCAMDIREARRVGGASLDREAVGMPGLRPSARGSSTEFFFVGLNARGLEEPWFTAPLREKTVRTNATYANEGDSRVDTQSYHSDHGSYLHLRARRRGGRRGRIRLLGRRRRRRVDPRDGRGVPRRTGRSERPEPRHALRGSPADQLGRGARRHLGAQRVPGRLLQLQRLPSGPGR